MIPVMTFDALQDISLPLAARLVLILCAIGGAGGFLSGLLGVGGGIIFVPTLYFAFSHMGIGGDHVMHMAVATSLAVVLVTVLSSARNHHRMGGVDTAILRHWGPYLAAGVLTGTAVAGRLDGQVLKQLFAVVTFIIALYMAFGRDRTGHSLPSYLGAGVQKILCIIIGLAAAMIGMGGAVLTVPLMTATGVPMSRAVGTGAALGVLVSLPGVAGYIAGGWDLRAVLPPFSLGFVNVGVAAFLVAGSVVAVPYGVRLSHRLDRRRLRLIFSAVLIIVSLRMMLTL